MVMFTPEAHYADKTSPQSMFVDIAVVWMILLVKGGWDNHYNLILLSLPLDTYVSVRHSGLVHQVRGYYRPSVFCKQV